MTMVPNCIINLAVTTLRSWFKENTLVLFFYYSTLAHAKWKIAQKQIPMLLFSFFLVSTPVGFSNGHFYLTPVYASNCTCTHSGSMLLLWCFTNEWLCYLASEGGKTALNSSDLIFTSWIQNMIKTCPFKTLAPRSCLKPAPVPHNKEINIILII